ncbi:MAG: hypothetical protein OSB14_07535 [Planctomycetota bacterium]|nr:hypothetical protein [Planctomycetota bacterium]
MRYLFTTVAALLIAGTSLAQGQYRFNLDSGQSGFTWSGSTSLGNVVPDSTNQHSLSGYADVSINNGSYPLSTGSFEGGVMNVSPNIAAYVSGPLGINLADIDVNNLSISARTTGSFSMSPGSGSFTATVENTILSGQLVIDPLAGSTINQDLAGTITSSQVTGNIYKTSSGMHFSIPLNINISGSDPGSGVSGSVSINGTITGDFVATNPNIYCIAAPNSGAQSGGQIGYWGSTSVSNNDLTLIATGIPTNQFGIFYYGPNAIQVPFGNGYRCVGGGVYRMNVLQSGATGSYQKDLDFYGSAPFGAPEVDAGETWRFQCWFRDPPAGGSTFNLTNAISVDFIP